MSDPGSTAADTSAPASALASESTARPSSEASASAIRKGRYVAHAEHGDARLAAHVFFV